MNNNFQYEDKREFSVPTNGTILSSIPISGDRFDLGNKRNYCRCEFSDKKRIVQNPKCSKYVQPIIFESMKARELAEILMQNPDWEVLINPDELRGDYMGCPYQQTIQSVEFCFWKNIPVDGKAYEIKCKNHFVAERGYKL